LLTVNVRVEGDANVGRIVVKLLLGLSRVWSLVKKRPDVLRWHTHSHLEDVWRGRTELAVDFLPDSGSILEIGAGKSAIRPYLGSNHPYTPSDLVARGDDYLIIDASRSFKLDFQPDIILALGVFEYVATFTEFF
jgi:hypothetical protein